MAELRPQHASPLKYRMSMLLSALSFCLWQSDTWFVPPGQFDTQTVEVEGVSVTLVIPGHLPHPEEKHPARTGDL